MCASPFPHIILGISGSNFTSADISVTTPTQLSFLRQTSITLARYSRVIAAGLLPAYFAPEVARSAGVLDTIPEQQVQWFLNYGRKTSRFQPPLRESLSRQMKPVSAILFRPGVSTLAIALLPFFSILTETPETPYPPSSMELEYATWRLLPLILAR